MSNTLDLKENLINNNSETENNVVDWNNNIDKLLASWCDNAKCYEWMHTQSYDFYSNKAKIFMITINILTTISGLSNIIAGSYTIDGFQISWIFGSISIIASTLNIIQDKLAYNQRAESHRKLVSDWLIIRNKIEEVLILPPSSRKDCKTFLKYIKHDINNAITEKNNMIPKKIREDCNQKFKNIEHFDMPDICGQIEHTKTYIEITD
jgi:hypothetical protein